MSQTSPSVVLIAGPNGAGKSTIAPALLRGALGVQEFVNADAIAHGLSAFDWPRLFRRRNSRLVGQARGDTSGRPRSAARHKRNHQPIVIYADGAIGWVKPEEIDIEDVGA